MKYFSLLIISAILCVGDCRKHGKARPHSRPTIQKNFTSFESDFFFGVGTSAYQIEGAWNSDGKGVSIWDTASHTPGRIIDGTTADVACDSYHKYEDDIQMLKKLKVHCYRFSIAWSRVLPSGTTNNLNQAGVEYYNRLIDGLIENGITPMITLFHWDTPQPLQDLGGWANEDIVGLYVDYADKMFELFGDRVKTWGTMNEPANYCTFGYSASYAPFIDSPGIGAYLCTHNIIRAHGKTYRMYQQKYKSKQGGRISITLDSYWAEPENPDSEQDRKSAKVSLDFHFGWYAWPIFKTGDYPKSMRQHIDKRSREQGFKTSRLPHFTYAEKAEILGSYDFLGLNHYSTIKTRFDNQTASNPPSLMNDANIFQYVDPTWKKTASDGMTVRPESFRKLILWVGQELGPHVEIAITENGYNGFPDESLNDQDRVDYINSYLQALLDAKSQGANVKAYTFWSLMDNFEWVNGYTMKFGLYHVDFASANRTRKPKKSAMVFQNIIVTRDIDSNLDPQDFIY